MILHGMAGPVSPGPLISHHFKGRIYRRTHSSKSMPTLIIAHASINQEPLLGFFFFLIFLVFFYFFISLTPKKSFSS